MKHNFIAYALELYLFCVNLLKSYLIDFIHGQFKGKSWLVLSYSSMIWFTKARQFSISIVSDALQYAQC